MISAKLAVIIAAELILLFAVVCTILVIKNRALKKIISKLQERMAQIVDALKIARANKPQNSNSAEINLDTFLESQINATDAFYKSLNSPQDIILDIEPEANLDNRTAALRFAVFTAERKALQTNKDNHPDWSHLSSEYEVIFKRLDTFTSVDSDELANPVSDNQEEVNALNEELTNAKKRINNLERFKQLYFELESNFQECKGQASKYYAELKNLSQETSDPEAFEHSLESYHSAYDELSKLIDSGIEGLVDETLKEDVSGEIRHLRSVAADQHKIIAQLQKKLQSQTTTEEKESVMQEMQVELEKQMRFVKESETCIQLMEEELNNANREITQLQNKLKKIPQLKREFTDIRDQNDMLRDQTFSLKTANRRLTQTVEKLTNAQSKEHSSPSADNAKDTQDLKEESQKLKDELADLRDQYANLEEKFLDLKMQNP